MQRNVRFEPLWQDRDIRFDASSNELSLRSGEKVIETFSKVEDTKGNTGEIGKLVVTNLRLMWQSLNKPRINLTIGFNCISTITNRMIHTKLRGKNESLYMMTKVNGTRYEFIFIRLEPVMGVSREMVDLVGRVCKAYVNSRLYRDLRLRSAIISPTHKQLKILQSEQIYNTINGVWNLSSDQGNLGTMYLTNVRVVWHANMNELFNISLPFIQIRNIKVRESKFGIALVIESSESSGGYVLGFRVDPVEKLNSVFEELSNLYVVHSNNPDFGVQASLNYNLSNSDESSNKTQGAYNIDSSTFPAASMPGDVANGVSGMITMMDNVNESIINSNESDNAAIHNRSMVGSYEEVLDHQDHGGREASGNDPVAAYLAEGESNEIRPHEWTYNPALGLSIEKIKEGFTFESLWEVVNTGTK